MSVDVLAAPGDLNNQLRQQFDEGKKKIVENDDMVVWDRGVFLNELLRQGLVLSANVNTQASDSSSIATTTPLKQGTFKGTSMALTELYSLFEQAAVSHFDTRGFEPIVPKKRDLTEKKNIYQWSDPKDNLPPHLETHPKVNPQTHAVDNQLPTGENQGPDGVGIIFDLQGIQALGGIAQIFTFAMPDDVARKGTPFAGPTIADCEKFNREHKSPNTDIMEGENLGFKDDWFSDARFAQQHLSGVNPSTIEVAAPNRVKPYIDEANRQGLDGMKLLLSEGKDLLIQDYSYFREATGVKNEESFVNAVPEINGPDPPKTFLYRYACASVVIFQLHEDGRIHPLAITLDHKGSLDKSITIFNRRLKPDDKGPIDEKDDWPWRYAKTCAQTADWTRHEIATHLVDTHMIEEAIIVATNRTIPEDHLLYEVLSPHWFRTLALNAAARAVLVPYVIARLAGFGPIYNPRDPSSNRAFGLINYSYKKFNFQDKYIPNDLKKRGFNIDMGTFEKYRNYPYATNMTLLWEVIRDFVKAVLVTQYKSDTDIRNDPYIADWCKEIQIQGQIPTFPTITTVDQLIDAVTMCIHTASPQHTAVNYLQDYYYSFVPSKPAALCTPLPKDLKTLQAYTEADLTAALPIGIKGPVWKDWLLSAQLPELLSYKVESRYNLITYAKSLYNVNKHRTASENKAFNAIAIKEAAAKFYSDLKGCESAFTFLSEIQTPGTIEYKVLQPELTAVSILI